MDEGGSLRESERERRKKEKEKEKEKERRERERRERKRKKREKEKEERERENRVRKFRAKIQRDPSPLQILSCSSINKVRGSEVKLLYINLDKLMGFILIFYLF